MASASPYRTTDELGALEQELEGAITGTILFGMVCVGFVILLVVGFSFSVLGKFGSLDELARDAGRGGDSQVLLVPFFLAFAALLGWLVRRTLASVKNERVRFFERGLELVDRKGGLRSFRYEDVDDAEYVRDRGRNIGLRVKLASGGVHMIGAWFELERVRVRLLNKARVAKAGAL